MPVANPGLPREYISTRKIRIDILVHVLAFDENIFGLLCFKFEYENVKRLVDESVS